MANAVVEQAYIQQLYMYNEAGVLCCPTMYMCVCVTFIKLLSIQCFSSTCTDCVVIYIYIFFKILFYRSQRQSMILFSTVLGMKTVILSWLQIMELGGSL